MNFEKEQKIEELLNSYLDGELSQREQVEVQRLVSRDEAVARRLRELERCRLLVSSLPPAEPPAEVVSGIKKLLHSRMADIADGPDDIKQRRGVRQLFVRQVLAASVIIGLAGLLIVVIYQIIGPQSAPRSSSVTVLATKDEKRGTIDEPVSPTGKAVDAAGSPRGEAAGVGFYSLKLQTGDFVALDAFVNKLLIESPWLKFDAAKEVPGRSVYRVVCNRGGLETLVFDLAPAWTKFDSATLVVHTDIGQYVTVESVQPEQITKIANQDTPDERIRVAKDFAVLNGVKQLSTPQRLLALADIDYPPLTTIPRPALTSGEKRAADTPKDVSDRVRVDLTIKVSGH